MLTRCLTGAVLVFGCAPWLAAPALAQGREAAAAESGRLPLTLRGSLGTWMFVHGDVDDDAPAPEYGDAFGPALSLSAEADLRFTPLFSGHVGAGYTRHFGDSAGSAEFDDFAMLPSWIGGKLHLPLPQPDRYEVYGRADIGWAITMPVDYRIDPPGTGPRRVELYDAEMVFLLGLGVGAAVRLPDTPLKLGVEMGYRLLTGPDVVGSSGSGEPAGAFGFLVSLGYVF
jgi:hypothetical protein